MKHCLQIFYKYRELSISSIRRRDYRRRCKTVRSGGCRSLRSRRGARGTRVFVVVTCSKMPPTHTTNGERVSCECASEVAKLDVTSTNSESASVQGLSVRVSDSKELSGVVLAVRAVRSCGVWGSADVT